MLILSRRKDEAVRLSNGVRIAVTWIEDGQVTLAIDAPPYVHIWREELGNTEAWHKKHTFCIEAEEWRVFMDAVAEMRHRQMEYMRTQSQSALRAAHAAEKRVDEILENLTKPRLL